MLESVSAKEIAPIRDIRPGEQNLGSRLLAVPAGFDCRHFRRLMVDDIFAVEVSEDELERQQNGREVKAHAEHDAGLSVKDPAQQIPRPSCGNAEGAGQIGGEEHMWEAHPEHRAKNDLGPVVRDKASVIDDIADWHLHPAIVDHDPKRRERGPSATMAVESKSEPRRDSLPPEQQDTEEARLEREGGESLVNEERSLDRSGEPRELAPIGAELEGHDDAGHHAEPEGDTENLEPEFKDETIGWTSDLEVKSLQNYEPCSEADREGWEYNVERDGEGELKSRQQEGQCVRRSAPIASSSRPASVK